MKSISTDGWGFWEWYGLREVVVEGQADQKFKNMGLIDPEYREAETKIGNYIFKSELVSLNADPRLEMLWQGHLSTFKNCGRDCHNIRGEMIKDDRCKACGGGFDDETGERVLVCQQCGNETDKLFGHVMGDLDFCKTCNDAKRQQSRPCGMCGSKRWDCCC